MLGYESEQQRRLVDCILSFTIYHLQLALTRSIEGLGKSDDEMQNMRCDAGVGRGGD